MLKIGIIGDSEISDIANILNGILSKKKRAAKNINSYKTEFSEDISFMNNKNPRHKNDEVLIEKIFASDINYNNVFNNQFDILVINKLLEKFGDNFTINSKPYNSSDNSVIRTLNLEMKNNYLKRNGVIVVNSDEKNIFKTIKNSGNLVITYGLNNKACVTASSITDTDVVCCIQRSLPTISGGILEQQEFAVRQDDNENSVTYDNGDDGRSGVYSVLAAVTAALVNDCEI